MQEKRRKLTTEDFEAFYGSRDMGAFARVVYPYYFWWLRAEFEKAKTPQERAVIHATPRAHQFWFMCGLVCAVPVVLVAMFLLHQGR